MSDDVRYHWQVLDAGPLLLDGGGMFGLIPRVVWSRVVEADEKNRIALRHNCLLLTSTEPDPALGRPRRVVIETGSGDKLNAKMSSVFGLGDRTIEHALREVGVEPDEIDDVVVSHLHFDHAGGLTRRPRAGETPDWTPDGPPSSEADEIGVRLTFPNATVHVQAIEWNTAIANNSVMTKTYYRDHLDPIQPRLRLAESPTAFQHDRIPNRGERPASSVEDRCTEALPGVQVFLASGHTWGQQAVLFHGPDGSPVLFTPDVLPTAWHVGATYSLAYDVEPYTSMVTKRWLLHDAAERGWTLVLDHDPLTPVVRVRPESDWFALEPVEGPIAGRGGPS
ncbi:MAG: MBL fold metallo-hydrolase [Planctomycetota bacterium]